MEFEAHLGGGIGTHGSAAVGQQADALDNQQPSR